MSLSRTEIKSSAQAYTNVWEDEVSEDAEAKKAFGIATLISASALFVEFW
jgi:hypothetical protein